MEPSILIVGGGTFGTSTAYHLAQKYKDCSRVVVVDRAPSPPKPAAAIDINRVIRTDYPNPLYCDLAFEALHSWFWNLELGHHFHKVGWLMLNEEGSDISDRINATLRCRGSNCAEEGLLHKLDSKWDGILTGTNIEGFNDCYFNPEAGWVDAASATASLMDAAVQRGVKRVTADVTELLLDQDAGRVEGVRLANGHTLTADKVLLAAGAWTSALLSPIEDILDIREGDRVERQVKATGVVSAYYRISDEEVARITKAGLPVVVYGGNGEVIPPSPQNKLMKYSNSRSTFTNTITTKTGHKISVPRADQSIVPESLMRETEALMSSKVAPLFTQNKKPEYWRVCYDAQTPTEDWLLCKHPHPKLQNLYLAVGGSFHSYKFMPNAGKYILNVLDGVSNGEDKDKAWAWKSEVESTDVRELGLMSGKAIARRELKDFEGGYAKL